MEIVEARNAVNTQSRSAVLFPLDLSCFNSQNNHSCSGEQSSLNPTTNSASVAAFFTFRLNRFRKQLSLVAPKGTILLSNIFVKKSPPLELF